MYVTYVCMYVCMYVCSLCTLHFEQSIMIVSSLQYLDAIMNVCRKTIPAGFVVVFGVFCLFCMLLLFVFRRGDGNTQKSENHVPRQQPPMHVQLGYKNSLDGMSLTHSDKTSPQESHDRHPNTSSEPGYGTYRSDPRVYRKNLRLFPCCGNQLDATLQEEKVDIRHAKNRQTQSDNAGIGVPCIISDGCISRQLPGELRLMG